MQLTVNLASFLCSNLPVILLAGDGACDLGRTHDYIVNSLQSKANVCLVCIESIKKTEPVGIELFVGVYNINTMLCVTRAV